MHVDCLATLPKLLLLYHIQVCTCCSIILLWLDRSIWIRNCFRFCCSHFINFANKIQTVRISCVFFIAIFIFVFSGFFLILTGKSVSIVGIKHASFIFGLPGLGQCDLLSDCFATWLWLQFCWKWVFIYCENCTSSPNYQVWTGVVACQAVMLSNRVTIKRAMKCLLTHVIMFISSPLPLPLSVCDVHGKLSSFFRFVKVFRLANAAYTYWI